jgi:hypothetical protein
MNSSKYGEFNSSIDRRLNFLVILFGVVPNLLIPKLGDFNYFILTANEFQLNIWMGNFFFVVQAKGSPANFLLSNIFLINVGCMLTKDRRLCLFFFFFFFLQKLNLQTEQGKSTSNPGIQVHGKI